MPQSARRYIVYILWLLGLFGTTLGATPTLNPETLTDVTGNSADGSSNIQWADLTSGSPYTSDVSEKLAEGLGPYFSLMHGFIEVVFSKGIPKDIVAIVADGDLPSDVDGIKQYQSYILGYGICVAVGALFLVLFPIIACCFCCCRCCGNCGGKMYQSKKDAGNSYRKNTLTISLLVVSVFLLVGTICIYINNDNMTDALEGVPGVMANNVDDLVTYVNNTVQQANQIAVSNFNFTRDVIFRDIDNINILVGVQLQNEIESQTKIRTSLSTALSLNADLVTANGLLTVIDKQVSDLGIAVTTLDTDVKNTVTAIGNIFTACGMSCPSAARPAYNIQTGISTTMFPDLTGPKTSMGSALSSNLTAKIVDAENELDNIPARVESDSAATRKSLKTTMSDLSDQIDPVLDQIRDFQNKIGGTDPDIDLDKMVRDVVKYVDDAKPYDTYRHTGGLAIASIMLCVSALTVLGIAFGIMGSSTSTLPHERGFVSSVGGLLLMTSVGLVFLFTSLLMLLTTVTFVIGAPLQAFVCKPVTNMDTMAEIVQAYSDYKVGKGNYLLGDMVFKNKSIPLRLTDILRDCKSGNAAWSALKLGSKFDVDDLLNYSKTLDVQKELDAVNIDFSTINVFPTALQSQLGDVNDAMDIDFALFSNELNKPSTDKDPNSLADELDTYADTIAHAGTKGQLKAEANHLRHTTNDVHGAKVKTCISDLNSSVSELEQLMANISKQVDILANGLNTTDRYIQTSGPTVVRTLLDTYVNRLLGVVDSYTNNTKHSIFTKMGTCEPIWNLYESLLVTTVCNNLLDSFNGFWFALGWCVFFSMPGTIFSVKLAKYFRRMTNSKGNKVNPLDNRKQKPMSSSPANMWMRSNKVHHYDNDW